MLDNRTLIFVELLIPLSFMIIQLVEFGWTNKQAVKANISANFFQFLGYLLLFFTVNQSNFLIIILSNISISISSLLMILTTFILFNVKIPKKLLTLFGILIIIILLGFRDYVSILLCLLFIYSAFVLVLLTIRKSKPLLWVFIVEFIILSFIFIMRFVYIVFPSSLTNNLSSTILILGISVSMLVWNYTIQLKRNSLYGLEIEENANNIFRIQEDLSILNYIYFQKSTNCSIDELYNKISELLAERFLINEIVIFGEEYGSFKLRYSRGVNNQELQVISDISQDKSISYKAFKDNIVVESYIGEIPEGEYKSLLLQKRLLGAVSFPLWTEGNAIGSISLGISPNSTIIKKDREIFIAICRQIAGVLYSAKIHNELIKTQNKLKEMATIDHLTGIYNRREFFHQFKGELNATKRHNDILTLFMIDIDDFKKVNDTYGHDVGDMVLRRVVSCIRTQLRENDLFARYGGEEFVGVLLRSDNDGANKKIKSIIEDVSKIRFEGFPELKITISAGSSSYKDDESNIEQIIKKADIALYKAKKQGKNRLSVN